MIKIMVMKLCVFPNDPITAYYEKGEIKENYFNPENIFDEVHIISFFENDIEEFKVQKIVGNAKLKIHSVGKINIKNRKKEIAKIIEIVKRIAPDVIRTYNPLIEGWCASFIAKKLNIPCFVSLHTQYDHNRQLMKKTNLKKYFVLKYTEKFIEPYILQNASKITIVYKIIDSYVSKHTNNKPELLYNKVDCKKFYNSNEIKGLPKPLILSVGNLIESKNHKLLIESMKKIDANLLIIGNGKLYEQLTDQIRTNSLEKKISIIKSVPNDIISQYYKTADIFALLYDVKQEGLPMPVMESMAAGTPVIIPKSVDSEGLEEAVLFSEYNIDSFSEKIIKLFQDEKLRNEMSLKGLRLVKKFDSKKIEKREAEIYMELVKKSCN
jgi:1,2-diacylglycerol 3-alpha-glucosyltransferase